MPRIIVIKHIDREGPGLIESIAKQKGLKINTYRIYRGDSLPTILYGDLIVIMGGPMGLSDIKKTNFEWMSEEINFIRQAVKKDIPVLGICLGAQLLAYAMGGRTKKLINNETLQPTAEIGWSDITFSAQIRNNPKNNIGLNPVSVLHWHSDRIILPLNSKLIASSESCKEQIFILNNSSIGIQCHLEVTNQMVLRWIKEDKGFIIKALGEQGQELLLRQQKIYGDQSEKERIRILNDIIDIMINNKK